MRKLYSKWIVDWETRLTTRDNNRVVRPFEWGIEWTRNWPQVNGNYPSDGNDPESHARFILDVNRKIIATSDDYFGYETPADFHLTKRVYPGERERTEWLEFTSPIQTPVP